MRYINALGIPSTLFSLAVFCVGAVVAVSLAQQPQRGAGDKFKPVDFEWSIVAGPKWADHWARFDHADGRKSLIKLSSVHALQYYPPEWGKGLFGTDAAAIVVNVMGHDHRLDLLDAKRADELFDDFIEAPEFKR